METKSYSPEEVKRIYCFSNTIQSAQQFEVILEESRAAVLTVKWNDGILLLDKRYINFLHKFGFWQYQELVKNGLETEALDILEGSGAPQRTNFDYLLQVDQEYNLLYGTPQTQGDQTSANAA